MLLAVQTDTARAPAKSPIRQELLAPGKNYLGLEAEVWHCTEEEYHADKTRFSKSQLWSFVQDQELHHLRETGFIPPREGDFFDYGHTFERLIFANEIPQFDKIVIPDAVLGADGAKRGGKWEQWKSEFIAANGEAALATAVKERDKQSFDRSVEELLLARRNLIAHSEAEPLIYLDGIPFIAFKWRCPVTGLPMKSQVDYWNIAFEELVDLKTAADVDAWKINDSVGLFGYHVQQWMYQIVFADWSGQQLPFRFVFSRNRAPWNCEVYRLDYEWMDLAEKEYNYWMTRYMQCRESGEWRSATFGSTITIRPKPWRIHKYV